MARLSAITSYHPPYFCSSFYAPVLVVCHGIHYVSEYLKRLQKTESEVLRMLQLLAVCLSVFVGRYAFILASSSLFA